MRATKNKYMEARQDTVWMRKNATKKTNVGANNFDQKDGPVQVDIRSF